MSDKVFVISGFNELKSLTELKSVLISDSINDNKTLYLFDSNNCQFYECVKQSNTYRSFFIDNAVVSDGNLYVCTHFDWIFIVLPFLMKKRKHFHSLFEILTDIFDKQISHKIDQWFNTRDAIDSIADIKYVNNELYVRYSSDKALEWLKCKTENTIDALIQNNINVSSNGCKVSGYKTGQEDEHRERAEYTKMAFDLISQYLNDEISADLKKELRLPEDSNDSTVSKTQIKRKANESESCEPLVDYSTYSFGSNTSAIAMDNKRSKMSRSERELLKVDKTGMKSISSFFKPKHK